ncbi:unnamed protein product [Withania somnifera]
MESKAWIIVFLLLATSFETLMAQSARDRLSDGSEGRRIWPALIGVPANFAKEIIQKDNPKITQVDIILNGSPVPLDYRPFRVRLFVNVLDYVVIIPVVG